MENRIQKTLLVTQDEARVRPRPRQPDDPDRGDEGEARLVSSPEGGAVVSSILGYDLKRAKAVDWPIFMIHQDSVLARWCGGYNTADIARALGIPECIVAAMVPRILEAKRNAA